MAKEDQVRISVRMPAAHAEALEKEAEAEDRTISAEIRRLVRRHLDCSTPSTA